MAIDRKEQSLQADGDALILDCQDTSSAVISVTGTFSGRLTVTGAVSAHSAEGSRMLYRSGVGQIGRNHDDFDGEVSAEYRCVTGGERLIVRASDWVSGSANVHVVATNDPSIAFVSGSMSGTAETAGRDGRLFTGGLTPTAATASNVAHIIIENPSDSGKVAFLFNRKFGNDNDPNDENIVYQAYVNPTVDTSSWNTSTGANFMIGGAGSGSLLHTFVGAPVAMGGIQASGEILPNGVPYDRNVLAVIKPGVSLGFTVSGSGGGGNAGIVSIIFEFYEESV